MINKGSEGYGIQYHLDKILYTTFSQGDIHGLTKILLKSDDSETYHLY